MNPLFLFLQIAFPAVPRLRPAMEELIAFHAGNLEAHEAPALSGDNWLLALAALDDGS